MTTWAPVRAQPDIEAFIWSQLQHLPGVTSFMFAAVPMWPPWVVAYSIQVDVRGTTKQATSRLAEQVRQIIWNIPAVPWDDGVISYCQPTEGPFWLPDDDGEPRYVIRAEIRAHPNRSVPVEARAQNAAGDIGGTVGKEET